jgi:hypothetical protein
MGDVAEGSGDVLIFKIADAYLKVLRETTKSSVMIVDVSAEIRTYHLSDSS